MKKVFYSILAIAAVAACTKPSLETKPEGFRITVSTQDTKPQFNSGDLSVSFKANEVLHVRINGNYYDFTRIEETDEFYCEDFLPENGIAYHYEILTPYRKDYGDNTVSFSGGVNCTMYGQADANGFESPSIEMDHIASVIRLNISNTGAETIKTTSYRIESDTDIIGGRFSIVGNVYSEVNPVKFTTITSGNDLEIAAGETKCIYLQCKPFTTTAGSKLTITLKDSNNKSYVFIKEFATSVTFEAGKVNTTTLEIPVIAEDAVFLSGSALSGKVTLEECIEADGVFAYCGELAAGELSINLSGKYEGLATPSNPYTISEADDYRIIVNTNTGDITVEKKSLKPNTQVSYNNTVDKINPFSQDVTELWMYGGYNGFAHDTGLLDGFQRKFTLKQSAANPQVFCYSGDAITRNAYNLKLQNSTESLVYLNFLVSNIQNNVWAYGSTAAAVRNSYNGCVITELEQVYDSVGGQGNNRYAYFSVPEGANTVIVTIDGSDNTKAKVKFLAK